MHIELALLNSAPRAATVRVAKGTGRLRVAALGEKAFTRLLGPVIDILSRHAASHYGADVGVGGHGQGGAEATGSSSSTMAGGNHDGQSAHLELNSPRSTSFSLPPLPPSSSSSSSTAAAAANSHSHSTRRIVNQTSSILHRLATGRVSKDSCGHCASCQRRASSSPTRWSHQVGRLTCFEAGSAVMFCTLSLRENAPVVDSASMRRCYIGGS